MKNIFTASLLLMAAITGIPVQGATSGSPGVAGEWELAVKGPAAHGDLTAVMELAQDGSKVTGTFTAHGKTHTLAGRFDSGELSLETTDTPADHTMTFTAKLKEDGTLAGYLSSSMGDMRWSASRKSKSQSPNPKSQKSQIPTPNSQITNKMVH